jgi:hypothetical protein
MRSEMMLKELFDEFIELSKELRPEYPDSLGKSKEDWIQVFENFSKTPELFKVVYSSIQGTKREIANKSLMDFIPGFRLIHIEELVQEKKNLDKLNVYEKGSLILPLLINYSSDYFCYVENCEDASGIYLFMHDECSLNLVYRTAEKFLESAIEFYKQHAYYLDNDGFLDYDFQKEGSIGASINPEVKYWNN